MLYSVSCISSYRQMLTASIIYALFLHFLEGGSGHLVVLACFLRATTKKGRQLGIAIPGSRIPGSRDPGPFFNPEIPGL